MSKVSIAKISRRRLMFAGAGAAGAAVAVAATMSAAKDEAAPVTAQAKAAPDQQGGYQETQHVLRYYQTARV